MSNENNDLYEQSSLTKSEALGIFKVSNQYANMRKDTFVVPMDTVQGILEDIVLSKETQENTVRKLVDRTPYWLELTAEEQKEEIRAALLLQTVAEYLYINRYITRKCSMYENGFDEEGNVVLHAFYVKKTELQDKIKNQFKTKKANKESKQVVSMTDYRKKVDGKQHD